MRRLNAFLLLAALGPAVPAGISAAAAADFPTVVTNILNAQSDGALAKMGAAQKGRMIACVNRVLEALPGGKKRFVVEGASLDDQEHRFGQVVMENRAEWKQTIAKGCSRIALQSGE